MNKTVWKYSFEIKTGPQVHSIPARAKLILVGRDPLGYLSAWFEVDSEAEKEEREFRVHGTGHPIEEVEGHLGSAVMGQFVWHLYEVLAEV